MRSILATNQRLWTIQGYEKLAGSAIDCPDCPFGWIVGYSEIALPRRGRPQRYFTISERSRAFGSQHP
jgi:hypothetical protein